MFTDGLGTAMTDIPKKKSTTSVYVKGIEVLSLLVEFTVELRPLLALITVSSLQISRCRCHSQNQSPEESSV